MSSVSPVQGVGGNRELRSTLFDRVAMRVTAAVKEPLKAVFGMISIPAVIITLLGTVVVGSAYLAHHSSGGLHVLEGFSEALAISVGTLGIGWGPSLYERYLARKIYSKESGDITQDERAFLETMDSDDRITAQSDANKAVNIKMMKSNPPRMQTHPIN